MSQCVGLLYRFIWKVCVCTGQSEQSKPLEDEELKQSVSEAKVLEKTDIKACKPALVVNQEYNMNQKTENDMASLTSSGLLREDKKTYCIWVL